MVDRHDRLRHERVAQHAIIRWEKSQQVSEASGPYGQVKSSACWARASPNATSSFSSRRRQDSPSDASLLPSSCRCQVSPVSPPIIDVVDPLSPPTSDVVDPLPPPIVVHADPVPPSEGEVVVHAEP